MGSYLENMTDCLLADTRDLEKYVFKSQVNAIKQSFTVSCSINHIETDCIAE